MDDGPLAVGRQRKSASHFLVPLSEQHHWIAAGEAIGSRLQALARCLRGIAAMLTSTAARVSHPNAAFHLFSPRAAGGRGRSRHTTAPSHATKGALK